MLLSFVGRDGLNKYEAFESNSRIEQIDTVTYIYDKIGYLVGGLMSHRFDRCQINIWSTVAQSAGFSAQRIKSRFDWDCLNCLCCGLGRLLPIITGRNLRIYFFDGWIVAPWELRHETERTIRCLCWVSANRDANAWNPDLRTSTTVGGPDRSLCAASLDVDRQ